MEVGMFAMTECVGGLLCLRDLGFGFGRTCQLVTEVVTGESVIPALATAAATKEDVDDGVDDDVLVLVTVIKSLPLIAVTIWCAWCAELKNNALGSPVKIMLATVDPGIPDTFRM